MINEEREQGIKDTQGFIEIINMAIRCDIDIHELKRAMEEAMEINLKLLHVTPEMSTKALRKIIDRIKK